jgi:hypothetical protein
MARQAGQLDPLLVNGYRYKSRELSRQNQKYVLCIPTVGISFPPAKSRAGNEKSWLFETLAYNLPREP